MLQRLFDLGVRLVVWCFPLKTLPFARWYFSSRKSPSILFMPIDVSRSDTHRLLYLEGERMVPERHFYSALLRPGLRVVDVGANIGYYALLTRSAIGLPGQIICFEPEPSNLSELKGVIKANGFTNIEVRPQAVGQKAGKISLALGLNGVVQEQGGSEGEAIEVEMVCLDEALDQPVDLIKIDVEGYELPVLKGAEKTIAQYHPTLMVEVHPHLPPARDEMEAIWEFLNQHYLSIRAYKLVHSRGIAIPLAVAYLGYSPVVEVQPPRELWDEKGDGKTFWVVAQGKA